MSEQTKKRKPLKRTRGRKATSVAKKRATRTTKKWRASPVHPNVKRARILIENIYWNGFKDRRGAFRISKKTIRDFVGSSTLSATTLAALVKNLKRRGFFMSPLDATANQWIVDRVDRIDPKKLPIVTDDIIREAEERLLI